MRHKLKINLEYCLKWRLAVARLDVCFSPNSLDTLGGSYGRCKAAGSARVCPANSLLSTVHLCLSESSKCIWTAQAREIWVAGACACRDCALVVVPRAFSHMVVTCRGRRKGNRVFFVAQSRLFVTGARDRSGFASKRRFRGRCSTLDMVVIFEAL